MSTLATTNIKHPSAVNPAIILDSDGKATVAGMGLVHINTTAFSAVSTVSINGCFSAAYDNYSFSLNLDSSAASQIGLRLRQSTTDTTSGYNYAQYFHNPSATGVSGGSGLTYIRIGFTGSANRSASLVDILSPFLSSRTPVFAKNYTLASGVGPQQEIIGAEQSGSTNSFDGLTVYPLSGTITGTIRVYGYKNS